MIPQSEAISPNNSQTATTGPTPDGNPQSEIRNPKSKTRPRKLDEAKRREICALVAGGCLIREAARYVRCSPRTVRREAMRNRDFQEQLRRSETYAQLSPLRAMQHAVSTHWRAAAWMLERAFPERFGRPESSAFSSRQARQLLDEVLHIIRSEVKDMVQRDRMDHRVRAAFEYGIHVYCDRNRSTRALRRAIATFEQKEKPADPLAQFGFPTVDLDALLKANPVVAQPYFRDPNLANDATAETQSTESAAEFVQKLIDKHWPKPGKRSKPASRQKAQESTTSDPTRAPFGQ